MPVGPPRAIQITAVRSEQANEPFCSERTLIQERLQIATSNSQSHCEKASRQLQRAQGETGNVRCISRLEHTADRGEERKAEKRNERRALASVAKGLIEVQATKVIAVSSLKAKVA